MQGGAAAAACMRAAVCQHRSTTLTKLPKEQYPHQQARDDSDHACKQNQPHRVGQHQHRESATCNHCQRDSAPPDMVFLKKSSLTLGKASRADRVDQTDPWPPPVCAMLAAAGRVDQQTELHASCYPVPGPGKLLLVLAWVWRPRYCSKQAQGTTSSCCAAVRDTERREGRSLCSGGWSNTIRRRKHVEQPTVGR